MSSHTEFQRRRMVYLTVLVTSAGVGLVAMFAWRSGRLDAGAALATFQVSGLGFLIWSIAGANWVLRAGTMSADTAAATDEARRRRRTFVIAAGPAAMFLWRRLQEFNASAPHSIGELIFLPMLWAAGALFFWWMFGSIMWRFLRVMRESQNQRG